MSMTIKDQIEFMIARKLTIEQCYVEINYWPEPVREEAIECLKEKMKEGCFDVPIKYHQTVILPPADPIRFVSKVPVKKVAWYKRIFLFKNPHYTKCLKNDSNSENKKEG